MRKITPNFALFLAVSMASVPASAERWVTLWKDYQIDLDSLHKRDDGKTEFTERAPAAYATDEMAIKRHMVDCQKREAYFLLLGRWRRPSTPTADDLVALDLICGKPQKAMG